MNAQNIQEIKVIGSKPGRQIDIPSANGSNTFELRERFKIRFQHFYAKGTNRLTATIATREREDGLVDVAVAIAHPNQGKAARDSSGRRIKRARDGKSGEKTRRVVEPPPSRAAGREESLKRLLLGNPLKKVFYPMEALYLLETGRNTNIDGAIYSPSDLRVVTFEPAHLSREIKNRTILRFFPGKRWVPELRAARQFDASKVSKRANQQTQVPQSAPTKTVEIQHAVKPTLGSRIKAFFGL